MGPPAHTRVSKRGFISRLAVRCDLPVKTVGNVYEALIDEIIDSVADGEVVVLTGFGRFSQQIHKGHRVRFGQTTVDDYPVLKFSASRSINRRLGEDWAGDEGLEVYIDVDRALETAVT